MKQKQFQHAFKDLRNIPKIKVQISDGGKTYYFSIIFGQYMDLLGLKQIWAVIEMCGGN